MVMGKADTLLSSSVSTKSSSASTLIRIWYSPGVVPAGMVTGQFSYSVLSEALSEELNGERSTISSASPQVLLVERFI